MSLLAEVTGPDALKRLTGAQCVQLAAEIRDFLVDRVSRTGGHLGPNLGAVELTIALHRVFDSPADRLVWDTGHQTYVHKILTGRQDGFATLRQPGGLSGYPSRAESEHDLVENSHASTALSWADGLAKAYALRGESDRRVVAIVGDGALTGGMCWEALNNIAAAKDRPLVIVVNDNGRSYAPTIGGLAEHLTALRAAPQYEHALDTVRAALTRTPVVGPPLYEALHGMKKGLKDLLSPQALFEDLGLKYLGPIDGHDVAAVEAALRRAKDFGGPVLVHCVTRKGFGYKPAEDDEADCLHGPGAFDPVSGVQQPKARSWTSAFGDFMVRLGADDPAVVAVTAAMLQPVGLGSFAAAYPARVFDVGIAEQHAVASAAGLAAGGLKPVVCVYATFANRAYDQFLLDVALHRLPVTLVLDRAGVTGDDGPSHNGMWDLALFQTVPGLRLGAPRDAGTLDALLREAVAAPTGPHLLRFPKGPVPADLPVLDRVGGVDVLATGPAPDVLLVAVGSTAATAVAVGQACARQGIGVTVVDPRWVVPVDPALVTLAAAHRLVVTVEDGLRTGGVGARVALALADAQVTTPVSVVGLPGEFLPQGRREDLLRTAGLDAQTMSRQIVERVSGTDAGTPGPLAAPAVGDDATRR